MTNVVNRRFVDELICGKPCFSSKESYRGNARCQDHQAVPFQATNLLRPMKRTQIRTFSIWTMTFQPVWPEMETYVTKELSFCVTNGLIHGSRMNAAPVGAQLCSRARLGWVERGKTSISCAKRRLLPWRRRRGGPSRAGDQRFLLRSASPVRECEDNRIIRNSVQDSARRA